MHETRSELKQVWNIKPLWKVVPFTWQFHYGRPWNLKSLSEIVPFTWRFHCGNASLINVKQIVLFSITVATHMRTSYKLKWFCATLFHYETFTVYIENSPRFEFSPRSNLTKWNFHRSEYHFGRSHVNNNNKVILHRSEILPRSEISNQFDFTSGFMQTYSK